MDQKIIGDFVVLSEIAKTQWGSVYKVKPRDLKRIYALKISEAHPDRINNEREILEKLGTHPNIVELYFSSDEGGDPYIVEEYVPCNLREIIDATFRPNTDRLSWKDCLSIIKQTLEALRHAHSLGVIHQDLKPSNMLLSRAPDGAMILKICDFNLAVKVEQVQDSIEDVATVAGTLDYLSPEQRTGEKLDQRSDLFNVGLLFYELLTRQKPAVASQPASVLSQNREVPGWVDQFISAALKANREERFQSASEMLTFIEKANVPTKVKLQEKLGRGFRKVANFLVGLLFLAAKLPFYLLFLPFFVSYYLGTFLSKPSRMGPEVGLVLGVAACIGGCIGFYGYGIVGGLNHNLVQWLTAVPANGTIVYFSNAGYSTTGYTFINANKLPVIEKQFVHAPTGRAVFALDSTGQRFVYLTQDSVVEYNPYTTQQRVLARSEIFRHFSQLTIRDDLILARLNQEVWSIDKEGCLGLSPQNAGAEFNAPTQCNPYEVDIASFPKEKLELQFQDWIPGSIDLSDVTPGAFVWYQTEGR